MANQVLNIALGRPVELYRRVLNNDPANSGFVIVALVISGDQDAAIKDFDTLSAILGDANIAEAGNTNYQRKVLTDGDLAAFSPDDVNNRADLDFADQTFSAIAAGDNWTDLLICYDPDTTAGDDTTIVPLTLHDFAATPDGSDIVAQIANWFRAQ